MVKSANERSGGLLASTANTTGVGRAVAVGIELQDAVGRIVDHAVFRIARQPGAHDVEGVGRQRTHGTDAETTSDAAIARLEEG